MSDGAYQKLVAKVNLLYYAAAATTAIVKAQRKYCMVTGKNITVRKNQNKK
ncbi:MAG: hypothetical protein M3299_16085 [Thermoproteota archaeon]|nr:hypothetical protein [Thermoproteota archaeon]